MGKVYREPDLFGGQGVSAPPRLCYDCLHRPVEYARRPRPEGAPACTFFSGPTRLDPLAARDACKGEFWRPPSDLGARD